MNTMQPVGVNHARPEKKRKAPSVVTWGGFIIAFLLLANPMPMLFDFLPDAIAYLFILIALRRAVGEIDVFNDFKKTTVKLFALTAAKIPAFFVMLNIWGGDARQRSIVAVFTLSFSIFECLFLRTWVRDLFDATARYGQRYHCNAALAECGHSYRLAPEKLEHMTLLFFLVRSILSCLPEMTLVPIPGAGGTVNATFNWNSLYPVCALAAAVVVLIFGILWCCYIIAYISRIARDKEASARMRADITLGSRAERENDFRLIRVAAYFLIGAVALQIDLLLDDVNYLPDVLSALLFFAAGYTLFSLLGHFRAAYILPLVYAGVALAYVFFQFRFYQSFDNTSLANRAEGALAAYIPIAVTGVLSGMLLIATCVLLTFVLAETIRRYTGITQGGLTARYIDERLRHSPPAEEETLRGAYGVIAAKVRRELTIKAIVLAALGGVTALCTTAKDLLMLVAPSPVTGRGQDMEFLTLFVYGWADTAIWVAVIAWLMFAVHFCSRMKKEAELNLIEE